MPEADDAGPPAYYIAGSDQARVIDMDTKLRKPLRAVRLTPKRSPEEQRRLGEAAIKALRELQREMRRNGMTPARAKKILRDLRNERKARRSSG